MDIQHRHGPVSGSAALTLGEKSWIFCRIEQTGTGKPITQGIKDYESSSVKGLRLWDSRGIELKDYGIDAVEKSTYELIQKQISLKDPDQFIHCIWYCVSGDRIQDNERDLLLRLMNTYQDKQNYINYVKGDIELEKKRLEALKEGQEEIKNDLEEKREQKANKMSELETQANQLEETSKLLTEKRKQALSDIDNEMAKVISDLSEEIKNGTSNTFTGSEFAYPVPGFTIITTSFGEVYNLVDPAGSAHTGADIAGGGINGTPIYAIQSGTVTTSGYSNYGYGNYIIINHGECVDNNSSYISLYGHCSSLVVREGEHVEKGQLIGYVGTTGISTGPHLHLEVRENGQRVNPLKFFPSISFTIL